MHLHTARIIILICYVQDYLAHFIHFYDIVQIHSAHFAVTLSSFLQQKKSPADCFCHAHTQVRQELIHF